MKSSFGREEKATLKDGGPLDRVNAGLLRFASKIKLGREPLCSIPKWEEQG